MRALVVLIAVLVGSASAAPRRCLDRRDRANRNGCGNNILLSFLPAGSSFLSTANECNGSTPTGTRGEALTFTRGSTAYCTKTDGTLVSLAVNQPRVTAQGLHMEEARTNKALRSSEFDNVGGWAVVVAAATLTVTANTTDVTAPDGTNAAEKVAIAGVADTEYAFLQQTITGTAAGHSDSVYLRTLSGTGTVYMTMQNGATWLNATCAMTSTWSRCKLENQLQTAAAWQMNIGLDRRAGSGQGSSADVTFYIWQAQREVGATASSTIATAGTTVTRSADTASVSWPVLSGSDFSIAETWCADGALIGGVYPTLFQVTTVGAAAERFRTFSHGDLGAMQLAINSGSSTQTNVSDIPAAGACRKVVSTWNATTRVGVLIVYNADTGALIGTSTASAVASNITDAAVLQLWDAVNFRGQWGKRRGLCVARTTGGCQ